MEQEKVKTLLHQTLDIAGVGRQEVWRSSIGSFSFPAFLPDLEKCVWGFPTWVFRSFECRWGMSKSSSPGKKQTKGNYMIPRTLRMIKMNWFVSTRAWKPPELDFRFKFLFLCNQSEQTPDFRLQSAEKRRQQGVECVRWETSASWDANIRFSGSNKSFAAFLLFLPVIRPALLCVTSCRS